eukprot:43438_1
MERKTKARIACIQVGTPSESRQDNLNLWTPLIETAAKNGTDLCLLPEFGSIKYEWHSNIWNNGEVFDISRSETLSFLHKLSKQYKMHLATTFLEVEGCHFFNCFVMFDDEGNIVGKMRKNTPPGLESFYYSSSNDKHILNTHKFGPIAVGICLENHLSILENEMILHNPKNINMLLSPHCVMFAKDENGVTKGIADNINDNIDTICIDIATKYNLNVIFSNKIGTFESSLPFSTVIMKTNYCGLSKIISRGGKVVSSANDNDLCDYTGEVVFGDIDISQMDEKEILFDNPFVGELSKGQYNSLCQYSDRIKQIFAFQTLIGTMYYNLSIKRRLMAATIYDGSYIPYLLKIVAHYGWLYTVGLIVHPFLPYKTWFELKLN